MFINNVMWVMGSQITMFINNVMLFINNVMWVDVTVDLQYKEVSSC